MSEKANSKLAITDMPEGTVTFLFTDIEGSTQLLSQLRDRYAVLLTDQRRILRTVFARWGGQEVDTQGDAIFVAFPRATQAVCAAAEIQRALAAHQWPEGAKVRVRMGLHTGEPLKADEGYVGMDVHRAARIAHVGHGGQVLLSETTTPLVVDELPEGVKLLELGRHRLKDMRRPEWIHQLVIEGLPREFPPLKSLELLTPAIALDIGEVKLPDFLKEETEVAPTPVFVGRERELVHLQRYLEQVVAGQGGLVLITGGPGRGKTALMQAFARRSMEAHPDLLVASGKCNAYTGVGDPYLPFRELLGDLTGDVGAKWAAGAISRDHAKRLWEVMHQTAHTLIDHGPDLVEVFVPGRSLLSRVSAAVPEQRSLLQSLRALAERERALPGELEQKALFEQYLHVLCELSAKYPLLVLLDDLQWADTASLNLLFHLGRELRGGRILLVGAYRPEEVTLGRGGKRHPLEEILAELKRTYGEVWIDLSQESADEGRIFVDEFINSEPNQLGESFRQALYAQTSGHPLFTIELLREMQARGDLVKDEGGYWIEGSALNWDLLPARVDGVIEARIGRLEDELREILSIASVEGEDFTAQVVARVKETDERDLVRKLSGELDKVHRLVGERGSIDISGRRLYLYRFQHHLFQKYLYNRLGGNEREMLHAEVDAVLEELYGESSEGIAAQLARHFSEAGQVDKAVHYLLLAGDQARLMYANQEAIGFYQHAIQVLKDKGDYELAERTLMKLGLTYHITFEFDKSRQAYEEAFTLRQQRSSVQPESLPPAPHPLRFFWQEPSSVDCVWLNYEFEFTFNHWLFSRLLKTNDVFEIIPDSAKYWEISPDGLVYTFHQQENFFWSDGVPVTAQDFEFSMKRMLDPYHGSPDAHLLYDIQGARNYHHGEISTPDGIGVRALDECTLQITLENPASYFLHLLAEFALPVPQHLVEKYREAWADLDKIVNNGPFCIQSWQRGEEIILARNPYYHELLKGNIEKIRINILREDLQTEFEKYENGQLDIINLRRISVSMRDHARQKYPTEYYMNSKRATHYLGFNTTRPPFDDRRIRQAFACAVEKEYLASVINGGYFLPAHGGFIPPGIPGHLPDIGLPYDPERARRLLKEAGYPDGRDFPNVNFLGRSQYLNNWMFLLEQWHMILGVEISFKQFEPFPYLDELDQGSFHIFEFGWTLDFPDPDSFLRMSPVRELTYWSNQYYEKLLASAHRTLEQGKRITLYQAAEKILLEETPIVPLYYIMDHFLVKPWVRNYPLGNEGDLTGVIIEPH